MNEVVTYSYDAWGKLLSTGGSLASTVGAKNPYRYRGYRYDSETGLYYLQSRYYDPNTGRFLNADDTDELDNSKDSVLSPNLYAYCDNNPVVRTDADGSCWNIIIGAVAGAAFSIGWQMIVEHKSFRQLNWYDVAASAISGGVAASGLGLVMQVGINAALGGISSAASGGDAADIGISTALGAASGFIGGRGANYKSALKSALKQSRIRIKGIATTASKKAAKRLATQTRTFGKRAVRKIIKSAVRRSALGSSASRVGYYYYNYRRRGHAY